MRAPSQDNGIFSQACQFKLKFEKQTERAFFTKAQALMVRATHRNPSNSTWTKNVGSSQQFLIQ